MLVIAQLTYSISYSPGSPDQETSSFTNKMGLPISINIMLGKIMQRFLHLVFLLRPLGLITI